MSIAFDNPLQVGGRNYFLCKAQGFRCAYCAQPLGPNDATRDHVHPKSRGGSDKSANIVAACARCNTRKGDRLPTACEVLFGVITWDIRADMQRTHATARPSFFPALRAARQAAKAQQRIFDQAALEEALDRAQR